MSSHNSNIPYRRTFRAELLSLLHRIVAIPAIYDLVQRMAGASVTQGILRKEFARLPLAGSALDVGGGTGLLRPLLPPVWKYTCVDIDLQKLEGFRKKFPADSAVQGSATCLPFSDESFDLAVLCSVSHHLADAEIAVALAEIFRVLKPEGRLLFHDALLMPGRLRSRILWSLDRGSNPRTTQQLRDLVGRHFDVERELLYSIHHSYVCWTLRKISSHAPRLG